MNDYTINPLNSNIFFSIGQPIMLILIVVTALAGLFLLISHLAKLGGLELVAIKWSERIFLTTLHAGLIWLGFTMVVSYISINAIDTINGVILISGAVTSFVRRITSDQRRANRTLFITYVFLAVALLWTFIFASVMNGLPATFRDSFANTFRPEFFKDLFTYWHWM